MYNFCNGQKGDYINNMKLSILICSLEQRANMLQDLLQELNSQINLAGANKEVEVLTDIDRGEKTIGQKRNDLLARARGEHIVYIDDDDWIYSCYISEILKALETNPDSLAISGHMTSNGKDQRNWFISIRYEWITKDLVYYRFPNHITPVRRKYALKAKFPPVNSGEDYHYSMGLKKYLKTEVKIEQPIYHYRYSTQNKSYQ